MNKWKKAISAGMSATLVASLLTFIAASSVLATTAVVSAGTVPVGGTSATAASFQFCENAGGSWAAGGTITVTIAPALPAAGAVTFTNATGGAPAPTFSQNPGGLGPATAVAAGSVLTVTLAGDDGANVLCFTVGGVYITAAALTTPGAIRATAGGTIAASTYTPATVNATGTLQTSQADTATTFLVNVTSTCPFVAVGSGAGPAGHFIIAGVDSAAGGTAGGLAVGQQTLTIAAALGVATTAGQAVTQAAVPNCATTALASPGTVANAVNQTAVTGTANPGEQNQSTGTTTITETATGYLAAATVLTFSISAPATGVTFSSSEWAIPTGGINLGGGVNTPVLCVLQIGATSCQVTVSAAGSAIGSVTLAGTSGGGGILIDMASTVPNGTAVNVSVAGSPAINVNVVSNTIANASRVIVGVASQPVIYINYNNQPSGMISLTEAGPGFFTASGVNDAFGLCIVTGESFTFTPYAIVATGDLKLLTSTSTGATTVVGTQYAAGGMSCARWSIYSASTVASTIDIVGATAAGPLAIGPANGPTLSVPGNLAPGTTQSWILVGSQANVAANATAARSSLVSNATRVYKSGVVVAAVSQPTMSAGSTDALAGNLTITETLNGQFKPTERICVLVLPRASNEAIQDTFLKTATTNDLPVITTNSPSGLLVSSVATPGCPNNIDFVFATGFSQTNSFSFLVNQQSFGGTLGVITIQNIHFSTTADAPTGPVLVSVFSANATTVGGGAVAFQSNVSNARIGSAQVDAWIAAGNNTRAASAFGLNTVITKQGSRVTFRFKATSATPGQLVQIWVKTKTTAWKLETNRRITSDGYAYYSPRVLNKGYRYYRVVVNGNLSNTVRAFGK